MANSCVALLRPKTKLKPELGVGSAGIVLLPLFAVDVKGRLRYELVSQSQRESGFNIGPGPSGLVPLAHVHCSATSSSKSGLPKVCRPHISICRTVLDRINFSGERGARICRSPSCVDFEPCTVVLVGRR